MATTTNYSWTTPDDTDLVKDGASAIRSLGTAIDTTTKNLNPSTTLGDIEYRSSTANTNTALGIGSTGQVLTVVAGVPAWAAAGGVTYAIFNDTKSSGTNGGTFTSGAFRTRDLNTTQVNDITGCSLSSNQITLAAGTYYVSAIATAHACQQNIARLENITDSTTTILGQSAYCDAAQVGVSAIEGKFTIAASKTFEVQHRCQTTRATEGFGVPNSFGDNIYTIITIAKVG